MLSRIHRAAARASGGLFDGTSKLSLTGKTAHFELGYIPESAKALKAESRELAAKGSELYAGQIFLQKCVSECRNEACRHVIVAEP